MKVYRLTKPEYAHDLSGFGASISGGRWNYPGEFILYTAQTSSLSILEALVHLNGVTIGIRYNLLVIEVDDSGISDLQMMGSQLPNDWAEIKNIELTRQIGSQWVKGKISPILKVPSVLNPLENNYLINSGHPDLSIEILEKRWYLYDGRLMDKRGFNQP